MKKIILAVLLLSLPGTLRAGLLDLDYLQPSPTKALAYSLLIPGGGFFYLADNSWNTKARYTPTGFLYLTATVALAAFTLNQVDKGASDTALMAGAALVGLRVLEFGDVTSSAERDRHKRWMMATLDQEAGGKE